MNIDSNPNAPTFVFDNNHCEWQMPRSDKFGLSSLLSFLKPEVAIEIGTYRGGSLEEISRHSGEVHSIDISDEPKSMLADKFDNVTFHVGPSSECVSDVVDQIEKSNRLLQFILVDGDHSYESVRDDINRVLKISPRSSIYVLMHDSFNPECRRGILAANWSECEFVHYVEVDFIPGVFHERAFDTAVAGTMWGGFAMAVLKPTPRQGSLSIHQSQLGLFEAVYAASSYASSKRPETVLTKARRFLKLT